MSAIMKFLALDANGVDEGHERLQGAVLVLADDIDVANFLAVDTSFAEEDAPVHPVSLVGAVQGAEQYRVAFVSPHLAAQIAGDGYVPGTPHSVDSPSFLADAFIDAGDDDCRIRAFHRAHDGSNVHAQQRHFRETPVDLTHDPRQFIVGNFQ